MGGICSAGTCKWCGCHFHRPSDVLYHRCAAMQEGYANAEPPNPDEPAEPSEPPPRGPSGDSVSFPLTNTVEDEERASWADREP